MSIRRQNCHLQPISEESSEKSEKSTSSVKTGTLLSRCRKTFHLRRKPKDNIPRPLGDVSPTRSRIIETIRRCRPNKKSGSRKK
jgi:hypothetical protein